MNANIDKKKNYHESPHIIICRSLNVIIYKCIILKSVTVTDFRENVYENAVELIFIAPTYNKYVCTFTVRVTKIHPQKIFNTANSPYQ